MNPSASARAYGEGSVVHRGTSGSCAASVIGSMSASVGTESDEACGAEGHGCHPITLAGAAGLCAETQAGAPSPDLRQSCTRTRATDLALGTRAPSAAARAETTAVDS